MFAKAQFGIVFIWFVFVIVISSLYLTACGSKGGTPPPPPQTTQMATPVISPSTSTLVVCSQSVSITDATAGAIIYYTTDGSTPTAASTKYASAFTVSCTSSTNTATIKAYAPAISSSYTDSMVGSATYTFAVPVATPAISPVAGSVVAGSPVSISDTTAGASIYYTVDGSKPTTSSTKYSTSFEVNASETVNAIAAVSGASYVNSSIASVTYTVVQNPTIQAGTLSSPVLLNATSVSLPITTTNCVSMTYTITPDFPVPTSNDGGVLGSVTYAPANACQPLFSPGSTMPAPTSGTYQYEITFTAIGATGTTSASASITVSLTTPAIVMDTNPVTPATLPAGNGDVTQTFNGTNCGFTSSNGLTSTDAWSGTLAGGTTPDSAKNGIPADFVDCNHVTMGISYSGFVAGDQVWNYLYNPPPGGGTSPKIITTVVATSNNSAVVATADGTTATLKSQSTTNYLDSNGKVAKTVISDPGTITFGANVVPAVEIQQLITCGSNGANFCGLGKNQLTVFASNGVATKSYAIPEDAKFAVANNDGGIYVFATNGHLYNLAANGTAVTLMDGFASEKEVTAAAINGNELAALSNNGQLQRFDVGTGASIGTYKVPADQNNLAYTADGSVLIGKLGSATVTALDRSGAAHTLHLSTPLKTLVQVDQSDPVASLATGDVVKVDSLGNTTLLTHAPKPEDLNAGFRILPTANGKSSTLVLAHVDPVSNLRQIQTLAVEMQK